MGFLRIAVLLFCSGVVLHAQQKDILFIGNSFTAYNGGVYQHLENLAAAATPSIAVNESHVIAGGQNLQSHWENNDVYGAAADCNGDPVGQSVPGRVYGVGGGSGCIYG